jgi:hypothetical protein
MVVSGNVVDGWLSASGGPLDLIFNDAIDARRHMIHGSFHAVDGFHNLVGGLTKSLLGDILLGDVQAVRS